MTKRSPAKPRRRKDADAEAATAKIARLAMAMFARAPKVSRVELTTNFADYDDEHHSGLQSAAHFRGTHQDEDLDGIAEARRLERAAEDLLGPIPFLTDSDKPYPQECATVCFSRAPSEATLIVEPADNYTCIFDNRRTLTWSVDANGGLSNVRKSIVFGLPHETPATSHLRAAFLRDPKSAMKLLCEDDRRWFTKNPLRITAAEITAEGGDPRIAFTIDPSCDLLAARVRFTFVGSPTDAD